MVVLEEVGTVSEAAAAGLEESSWQGWLVAVESPLSAHREMGSELQAFSKSCH